MVLRVFLVVCFLVAAIWGLNLFYNSNYFKIKSVSIEGNTHYSEEDLFVFISGISGKNIFEVNKKEIEDSLRSGLIWIRSVELRKIFPDRIVLMIRERAPELITSYRNNYYLLDDEGVILDKIGSDVDLKGFEDLIIVKDAFEYKLDPGEAIASKNILSCARIYEAMDDNIRLLIKEAGIEKNLSGDIFFRTHDNKKIIFGNSDGIIKKIEILKLLLKQETKYNIIDLRNPENPVVKE